MKKDIKLLILDVDGTMTDGGIYIGEDGSQFRKFNVKDGMGIVEARKKGLEIGIISHSRSSEMITTRANMLGLKYFYVGQRSKKEVMDEWVEDLNINLDQVAFLGDDINDLEAMTATGLAVCPADAIQQVIDCADIILTKKGGEGAVRELIDKHLI